MKKSLVILALIACVGSSINVQAASKPHKGCKRHAVCKKPAKKPVQAASTQEETPVKTTPKTEEEETPYFTGFMAFTNNYVFRGISQTHNLFAVQGSLTYKPARDRDIWAKGLYFNAWASNVNFADDSGATVELDTIVGYAGKTLNDWVGYDISLARYNYPGANQLAYNEWIGVLTFGILKGLIGYSPNVYNKHADGTYYNGGINYDVPAKYALGLEDVSVQASIGHYSLPKVAGNSYNDYNVTLNKKVQNYLFTLQWTGTNGRANNPPADDDHIIGMLTANF